MNPTFRLSSILLLLGMALLADTATGQSLSITENGASQFQIEAVAPQDTRYRLQASGNLHLWADIHDEVRGRFSYRFDGTRSKRRNFRLTPWTPPPDPIRLVVIGDSTAYDVCGWGQAIYGYFNPNALIINYAYPWTSTKVFLRSAEMDKLLVVKPNYVLIELGYVDANSLDPNQATTLEEYAENLRTIVRTVRSFDGTPILVTLHAGRHWDAQGRVIPAWPERSVVVRNVAAELQTPLIDLHQLTMGLYTELGPAGSKFMESECFPNETMHFSMKGGHMISRLIVDALPDALGPYLVGDPGPPPAP